MKIGFIGHRMIFAEDIGERLMNAIQTEIDGGCREFIMGTRGDFDIRALESCRKLRKTYKDLEIEVVITSLNEIKKDKEHDFVPYSDVKTVMYEIENTYYKRKITESNRQMIDECDAIISFVDMTPGDRSGAKTALRYAQKKGLRIVNLFTEVDKNFGVTAEELRESWNALCEKLFGSENKNKK